VTAIHRLAVVNRGEAAMRCLSAVAELNRMPGKPIETIALYTGPDAASWFVREATEAVSLGAATFVDDDGNRQSSYLDLDRVMAALAQARADAVWVGWGFAAESADFAERCERAGITFIGPPSDVTRLLGDKVKAKQLAERVGVPVVPWSGGPVHDAGSATKRDDRGRHARLPGAGQGLSGRWRPRHQAGGNSQRHGCRLHVGPVRGPARLR
jgi:acetyl/propionyl-CoA carboxylase alpha subunit